MADQRGLGQAGRAARVDVRGQVARACAAPVSGGSSVTGTRHRFAPGRQLGIDRLRRVDVDERARLGAELVAHGVERAECSEPTMISFGLADAQRVQQRVAGVVRVDQARDRADLAGARKCHRNAGRLSSSSATTSPLPTPQRLVRVRVAVHLGVGLAVGEALVAEQQERLVGGRPARVAFELERDGLVALGVDERERFTRAMNCSIRSSMRAGAYTEDARAPRGLAPRSIRADYRLSHGMLASADAATAANGTISAASGTRSRASTGCSRGPSP